MVILQISRMRFIIILVYINIRRVVLLLVFAEVLDVRGGGIFLLLDINSICSKRGKTFGDHHAVFEDFKTSAAGWTGLISWIE